MLGEFERLMLLVIDFVMHNITEGPTVMIALA